MTFLNIRFLGDKVIHSYTSFRDVSQMLYHGLYTGINDKMRFSVYFTVHGISKLFLQQDDVTLRIWFSSKTLSQIKTKPTWPVPGLSLFYKVKLFLTCSCHTSFHFQALLYEQNLKSLFGFEHLNLFTFLPSPQKQLTRDVYLNGFVSQLIQRHQEFIVQVVDSLYIEIY